MRPQAITVGIPKHKAAAVKSPPSHCGEESETPTTKQSEGRVSGG